jgi:hypothetical protein
VDERWGFVHTWQFYPRDDPDADLVRRALDGILETYVDGELTSTLEYSAARGAGLIFGRPDSRWRWVPIGDYSVADGTLAIDRGLPSEVRFTRLSKGLLYKSKTRPVPHRYEKDAGNRSDTPGA